MSVIRPVAAMSHREVCEEKTHVHALYRPDPKRLEGLGLT